jgi:arginase family enzyme
MEERLADRLVQVGIRTMTSHQRDQARRFGIEVIEMNQTGATAAVSAKLVRELAARMLVETR